VVTRLVLAVCEEMEGGREGGREGGGEDLRQSVVGKDTQQVPFGLASSADEPHHHHSVMAKAQRAVLFIFGWGAPRELRGLGVEDDAPPPSPPIPIAHLFFSFLKISYCHTSRVRVVPGEGEN